VNLAVVSLIPTSATQRTEITYTFFKQQVNAGNVATINSRGDTMQGHFRQQVAYTPEGRDTTKQASDFSTVRPAFADPVSKHC